ncbi:MAG: hypothetical protein IJ249_03405 [Paludibacteraceae bacterium]|nr:hypothetical protein [Paludibacteraceae bacterium]
MKKLLVLAVSAIVALNLSAQEAKCPKGECKKAKKECKLTPEQRVEKDIKILSEELYLSPEQETKFAATYREFAAAKAKLYKEYAEKFGKDLNERQVKAVMRFHGPKHGDFKHGKGPKKMQKPDAPQPVEPTPEITRE